MSDTDKRYGFSVKEWIAFLTLSSLILGGLIHTVGKLHVMDSRLGAIEKSLDTLLDHERRISRLEGKQ